MNYLLCSLFLIQAFRFCVTFSIGSTNPDINEVRSFSANSSSIPNNSSDKNSTAKEFSYRKCTFDYECRSISKNSYCKYGSCQCLYTTFGDECDVRGKKRYGESCLFDFECAELYVCKESPWNNNNLSPFAEKKKTCQIDTSTPTPTSNGKWIAVGVILTCLILGLILYAIYKIGNGGESVRSGTVISPSTRTEIARSNPNNRPYSTIQQPEIMPVYPSSAPPLPPPNNTIIDSPPPYNAAVSNSAPVALNKKSDLNCEYPPSYYSIQNGAGNLQKY